MKMRLLFSLCVMIASSILIAPAQPQQRDSRVALVIANASYPEAPTPLSTVVRDARTVADELRRSGFEVDFKENLGKEEMQRAMDAFTAKIRNDTPALFYFSGYGIQAARQSYLLPVNAQVWTEADLRRDGFSLDSLVTDMNRRGAKAKIVIIDAARRNPFERRFRAAPAGLAPIDAPEGTLTMYSTAPGKLLGDSSATSSLFTTELVKELRVDSLTAEESFNRTRIAVSRASNGEQVPWVASSLIEEFYFGTTRPSAGAPTPAPAAPSSARPPATSPPPSVAAAPAPSAGSDTRKDMKGGELFSDCQGCGEMVVVPAGAFDMGSIMEYENPTHRVTFAKPFAIGRYEVTFDEWDRCVEEKGCKAQPDDRQWGRGNRPAINISWDDAKAFTAWLSQKTGQTYRLPTEAEWEYAARAGTNTPYWWGREIGSREANCRECNTGSGQQTSPVGSYKSNTSGLYDTAGNVAEWVEDCWNDNYRGAPKDGSAWTSGQCRLRVLRGGAYDSPAKAVRSTARFRYDTDVRYPANGFRVVRELQ